MKKQPISDKLKDNVEYNVANKKKQKRMRAETMSKDLRKWGKSR